MKDWTPGTPPASWQDARLAKGATPAKYVLVIMDHQEHRSHGREQTVYAPAAIPEGASIQSPDIRYCDHRHTSYDAAARCGRRLVRQAEKEPRQ